MDEDIYCNDATSCTNTCGGTWQIAVCDTFKNSSDNAYHVVTYKDPGMTNVVLDGFTIRGGNANGLTAYDQQGAGIQIRADKACNGGDNYGFPCSDNTDCLGNPNGTCETASPKCIEGGPAIRNCIIERNYSANHGAINDHAVAGSVAGTSIEECVFQDNFAGMLGAGLVIESGSTYVTDCVFESNVVATDPNVIPEGGRSGLGVMMTLPVANLVIPANQYSQIVFSWTITLLIFLVEKAVRCSTKETIQQFRVLQLVRVARFDKIQHRLVLV